MWNSHFHYSHVLLSCKTHTRPNCAQTLMCFNLWDINIGEREKRQMTITEFQVNKCILEETLKTKNEFLCQRFRDVDGPNITVIDCTLQLKSSTNISVL